MSFPFTFPHAFPGGSGTCAAVETHGTFPLSFPFTFPGEPETTEIAYDVCADAESNLLGEYQDSPRLKALLCAFLCRIADLDRATATIYQHALSLDTAWGGHLDRIGKIVREGRNGREDNDYRRILRAVIRASRSRGTPEDFLEVLRLLESTTVARVQTLTGDASVEVLVSAPTGYPVPAEDVSRLLNRARAAGVRLHGSLPVTAGPAFALGRASAYPEGSTSGLRLADDPSAYPGGALSHAF